MSLETGQLVFVKDEVEGWLPATVGATNGQGEDMSLELVHEDGRTETVSKVSEDWLQRGDPSCLKGVEDMVKMDILTVGSVLHNLRTRYAKQDIYTSVGSILAAINPYVLIPSLYDENCMNLYANMATDAGAPPHPYELMELAYRGLITDHRSQSVLISGESGAGKTETTKYLLSYLSHRSSTMEKERREAVPSVDQRRNSIGGRFSVEDSVVMSNPVMEAFANAKTTRNHNSSRFGKYIQVTLHSSGVVTGGRVTTYLLEKTRVARQLDGERSYHVFYQLCQGANDDMRARLGLKEAAEFRSLTGGGCVEIDSMDDAEGFSETARCMESIGIGSEAKEGVFRVVAAVLHLLNVEFDTVDIPGQDVGSKVSEKGEDSSLSWASKLLGVKPDQLEEALVARFINPGGFGSADFVVVPSSPLVAESARDAVAKALYSSLFDWLVEKINLTLTAAMNSKTAANANNRFIGLLDIFGFEAFGTNSLEQLLINYANERLQQQFNAFVFKLEEEEFAKQGLSKVYVEHCRVEFADNDDVLRLLEGKPQGILSLLKEESTLKTGTGLKLGKRYRQAFKGNDRFALPRARGGSRAGTEATFGIVHFAGEVIYDATEFVEKNKDEVPTALHDLVLSSNDRFVANLLEEYAGDDTGGGGARGKRRGVPSGSSHRRVGGQPAKGRAQKGSVLVTGKFVGSLGSLMAAISETEPHYIRCVKPNEEQLPLSFQGGYILEQLNWMGMVQIVEIRQRGFSVRYPHNEFVCKYGRIVGRGPGQPDFQGPVEGENQAPAAWRDEAERISAELVHQGHMEAGKFHLGTTKIFLRTATQRTLDAAREEHVRKEAQQMLTTAIESRSREDLSAAVALATQLRLRSPQVEEAKLLIRELLREEALERVHVAMEEEDFDVLIKSIQAASAIGVRDPELESARSLCRDIQHRKDLVNKLRKATVGAGTCIEEGGDPVPHLEALDPILAELKELEATVKKAPTEEVDDARAIRQELKHLQEAPVLQAMEKEMARDKPEMGTLRSLIAMASDEVGVELGTETVDRCKAALQRAEELQAEEEAAAEQEQASVMEERSLEEQEEAARAAAAAAVEAEKMAAAAARAAVEAEEAVNLAAVQEGSFRQQAPATVQALARFRPEAKADPVDVAREMDILVPGAVANAIRMDDHKGRGGSAVLQESLERLMRDAQMNGIRQIPREPAPKPQATPSPPKEEGKEDYPYRHIPLYTANVRIGHRTGLHMTNFELLEALKKGTKLLKVTKSAFSKRRTVVKWVSVSDDLTKLSWSNDLKNSSGAKSMDLTATGSNAITGLTVGLETPILIKEWESSPVKNRLPSEWCYFSLHTPSRTYDFGSEDASVVLLWCIGLSAIIPEAGRKPPLCQAQKTFARKIDHRATDEEPVPLCPLLWPVARQVASAANDLGINDPCYRHQWWSAVELVESPLPDGFGRVVREDGTLAYRYPKSSETPGKIGTHPLLQDYMDKIDYESKLSTSHLRRSSRDSRRSSGGQALAASHPIRCFVSCFKGDLTAIRRFAMEGGDVDCRYEDAYERPWTVAMGGPDFSWAEPGLGANPLNYTLAFCDIIGAETAAGVVATLLELGADVNRDDGDPEVRYTPLHSAVANEAPGLVRTVLQHGARVNTPRGDRRIPLHTAMRLPAGQKKLSIIATLLVVGADIDRPEPFQGNTPLHMACKMGDLRTVELLLEAGADVSITNGGQRTASELVRVEISELEAYTDELTADMAQEEGEGSGGTYKGSVDMKAELGRTQSKVEKIREIAGVMEEWVPAEDDEDVLDDLAPPAAMMAADSSQQQQQQLSPTLEEQEQGLDQEEQEQGQDQETEEDGVVAVGEDEGEMGSLTNGVAEVTLEADGGEKPPLPDYEELPDYQELLPPAPVNGEGSSSAAAAAAVEGDGGDAVGSVTEGGVATPDGSDAHLEEKAAAAASAAPVSA